MRGRGVVLVGIAALLASGLGLAAAKAAPAPAPGCVATWPTYQHDARHTANGCSTLSQLSAPTLHPKWFTPTSGAVTAEPTVANNTVYVGDSTGAFHALDQATGASKWTFSTTSPQTCYRDQPAPYTERHNAGFGGITSSAAVAPTVTDAAGNPLVYFGGGGSLFALDAVTGTCQWAQDIDPGFATNSVEIESSPVVDTGLAVPEVLVGSDDNSGAGAGVTGLQAFDAATGALLWRYEPERDVTLTPAQFGGSEALTLSCGDASPNAYCNTTNVPGIGENSLAWADACGDVWSSPSLDADFVDPAGMNAYQSAGTAASDPAWFPKQITATGRKSHDGLVIFGTGNCGANPNPSTTYAHHDYAHTEGEFALDPVTGVRVWNFFEPPNIYNTGSPNEAGAGDTDFGSSSVLATVNTADLPVGQSCTPGKGNGKGRDTTNVVVQGGKSGYAYGICERDGSPIWSVQAAQPGQISPEFIGAGGGYIASASVGVANGRPAAFLDSALFLPFADDGVREPNDGDDAGATCPGLLGIRLPLLPFCLDFSIANDPARLLSLSAVDAATGHIVWRAPSTPSYSATSYSNGVVFAPSTTGFSDDAYNADTGLPLWKFPLGATTASGMSIVGSDVFTGAGLSESQAGPSTVPPGNNGVWSFTTSAGAPTFNAPGS
ncbi:MAG: PQQ-binding-like beta-propeller repeat protein [Acidimicrobiia bacterium]|nr:PQQ-binding-like beta-propeller repeat protein [Acidimicrobiia bacterium]